MKRERVLIFIFLILFYKILDTGLRLVTEPFKERSGIWQNWSQDSAGDIFSVPSEVLEMRDICAENKIKKFALSPELAENPLVYQRAVEFLFPIRIDKKNLNYFFLLLK